MLKGAKNKTAGPTSNSPDRLNRIVEGTNITGDVKTDSNFRLDGYLNGTLDTTGKLVVGVTGKIEGEVTCANADIEGEVVGNIKVDGLLMLKSTAKVQGNITAGKIGMENGAEFNGNCNMGAISVVTPNSNSSNSFVKQANVKTEEENKAEMVY